MKTVEGHEATRDTTHSLPRMGPSMGAVRSEGSPGETMNSSGKQKKAPQEGL